MYHLLSVSSAMLISFLIGLLFAAMCAIAVSYTHLTLPTKA